MKPCASPVTHCKYKVALRRNILSKPSGTSASPSCGYSAQCRGDASPARRRALPPGALLPPGLGGVGGGGGAAPPGRSRSSPGRSESPAGSRLIPGRFPRSLRTRPGWRQRGGRFRQRGREAPGKLHLHSNRFPAPAGGGAAAPPPHHHRRKHWGGGGGARQLLSNWEAA